MRVAWRSTKYSWTQNRTRNTKGDYKVHVKTHPSIQWRNRALCHRTAQAKRTVGEGNGTGTCWRKPTLSRSTLVPPQTLSLFPYKLWSDLVWKKSVEECKVVIRDHKKNAGMRIRAKIGKRVSISQPLTNDNNYFCVGWLLEKWAISIRIQHQWSQFFILLVWQ